MTDALQRLICPCSDAYLGAVICDGRVQVVRVCRKCGAKDGPLRKRDIDVPIDSLPVIKDNRDGRLYTCEKCRHDFPTLQYHHHWAPRHLFGDACDDWPGSNLCASCHAEWHRVVTPKMNRAGDRTPHSLFSKLDVISAHWSRFWRSREAA